MSVNLIEAIFNSDLNSDFKMRLRIITLTPHLILHLLYPRSIIDLFLNKKLRYIYIYVLQMGNVDDTVTVFVLGSVVATGKT